VGCNPEKRDYLEDIATNGRIEMHLESRDVRCVDCIHLALSRDQKWDVGMTLSLACQKCG